LPLDEKREPLHALEPGQRKGIQNQRVTLVAGDGVEPGVIRRIFHEFVDLGHSEHCIAETLNAEGVPSPGGRRWGAASVMARLRNETYVGTLLYNRTSKKLKTPCRRNPPEEWIRTQEAFEGIIAIEQFLRAQEILEQRRRKYDPDYMLAQLGSVYQQHGVLRSSLFQLQEEMPASRAYTRHFGSLDQAFQQIYTTQRDRARQVVHDRIRQHIPEVLPYSDFLVLDRKLALSVQPAVPIPHGYAAYWPFRPDTRRVIDITLGVLLSDPEELEILGYVALPRWVGGSKPFRFSSTCARTELFGRSDLAFLQHLL
jgi:hypothetical protein